MGVGAAVVVRRRQMVESRGLRCSNGLRLEVQQDSYYLK
jgi:hypothetical protein